MSSFAERHKRIADFPRYAVDYISARNCEKEKVFAVAWVGAYDGKYGRQPYVDLRPTAEGQKYLRVRVPKYTDSMIETMAACDEDMNDIKAGKVGIKFHSYKTKDGIETVALEWIDL